MLASIIDLFLRANYWVQVIYTVIQIVWTRNVHIALDKEDPAVGLQLYMDFLSDRYPLPLPCVKSQTAIDKHFFISIRSCKFVVEYAYELCRIQSLAEASRTTQLSPLQQAIIHSIMVIDQHCYSITNQLLVAQVHSSHAFEWTKHLRFYWDDKKHTCYVKQANNALPYGYEFLGLMPRDYISTLGSERYLLSFTDSLRSALGCSIVGETDGVDMIHELSRCLGR